MQVEADTALCLGAGMCALTAPQVFGQSEDDGTVLVLSADPPDEMSTVINDAVRRCPSGAIRLAGARR
jgi:ferredoxin